MKRGHRQAHAPCAFQRAARGGAPPSQLRARAGRAAMFTEGTAPGRGRCAGDGRARAAPSRPAAGAGQGRARAARPISVAHDPARRSWSRRSLGPGPEPPLSGRGAATEEEMVSPAASAGRLGSALPFLLVLLDLQYQGKPGRGPCGGASRGVLCRGRPRPAGVGPSALVAGPPPSAPPVGAARCPPWRRGTHPTHPRLPGPCRHEGGNISGKGERREVQRCHLITRG